MLALGEILLLLGVLGLVLWILSAPGRPPQDERLEGALAELRRQRSRLGKPLRGLVFQAIRYGQELRGLRRSMAELERRLAAANSTTHERLRERYRQLAQAYEGGVELLENLATELLLWSGPESPKGFEELEALRSSLRELLSPPKG
jgi:signal transduction histidine kinase